ncbi:MAG: PAS domain S-box protein [Desulfobacterales bacterium]|nr:PAS domain S-box protein [Desulfobacterales bacterium]
MRLRLILMVLSLLTFLSTSIGGYLYYHNLKESALLEAEKQAEIRVEMLRINLAAQISDNIRPARVLAGTPEIIQALINSSNERLDQANRILDHFQTNLEADVCYLMDRAGLTIASSNRDAADSFVGHNFSFRPYFSTAMAHAPTTYLALGTTSGKRGAYCSCPVYGTDPKTPIGVVVIKASIERVEEELGLGPEDILLVTNPVGVIFISNRDEWRYQLLWDLSREEIERIAQSRQFGKGPWRWTGLKLRDDRYVLDHKGRRYLMNRTQVENYPGWNIIHLRRLETISKVISEPLIRITGPVVFMASILIGFAVFFLYQKASQEILKRKEIQQALGESERRHRSLYNHTPAMLHSIDSEGFLLSVSDFWLQVMGYRRDEIIGRQLTDFFTESSRVFAERSVIPNFFRTGSCQDVPYQFRKANGEVIDVLLSAVAERDGEGRPVRSLAVSIDVTERNRAERALQLAQEELGRYTRGLEKQVQERTREITSILRYTPDVVSIKDRDGHYTLINTCFEDILGRSNDEVRGLTDADLFPESVARQFRENDLKVLRERRSFQFDEQMPHRDGTIHFYLSVKFPFYGEDGEASGVCEISTDITEVKKAQDQLRRLSASIMASQEKERAAIARELHDELGQVLTALRMGAVWIARRLQEVDQAAADRARDMCRLIDKNIEDVRGMAIRLRPGVLDDLGLVDALEWFTADFEKRTAITCVFEHNPIPPLDEGIATAAYRIAQEALTNVARHARATRAEVELVIRDRQLLLSVKDDGKGFEAESLSESEGLGVAGMKERANLVAGKLDVRSTPGEGTRIRFRVSFPKDPGELT